MLAEWCHDAVQVNSGLMGPEDFVRVTSTAAAQIYNIYPRKGTIAVGSDADVIVFDPRVQHTISASTHHSNMDTNVYEGKRVVGKVHFCTLSQPIGLACSLRCLELLSSSFGCFAVVTRLRVATF